MPEVEWPPSGYKFVWLPANEVGDHDWEVLPQPDHERRCRYTVGPGQKQCGEPSVVRMNRASHGVPSWWHYCGSHLYGRRLREGVLETAVLREIESGDAA